MKLHINRLLAAGNLENFSLPPIHLQPCHHSKSSILYVLLSHKPLSMLRASVVTPFEIGVFEKSAVSHRCSLSADLFACKDQYNYLLGIFLFFLSFLPFFFLALCRGLHTKWDNYHYAISLESQYWHFQSPPCCQIYWHMHCAILHLVFSAKRRMFKESDERDISCQMESPN